MFQNKTVSYRYVVYILFVAAFALRLVYVFTMAPEVPTSDAAIYDELAIRLSEGPPFFDAQYNSRRAPLYPAFLALIYRFMGHSYRAALIIQALFSASMVLLLFAVCWDGFIHHDTWDKT